MISRKWLALSGAVSPGSRWLQISQGPKHMVNMTKSQCLLGNLQAVWPASDLPNLLVCKMGVIIP